MQMFNLDAPPCLMCRKNNQNCRSHRRCLMQTAGCGGPRLTGQASQSTISVNPPEKVVRVVRVYLLICYPLARGLQEVQGPGLGPRLPVRLATVPGVCHLLCGQVSGGLHHCKPQVCAYKY